MVVAMPVVVVVRRRAKVYEIVRHGLCMCPMTTRIVRVRIMCSMSTVRSVRVVRRVCMSIVVTVIARRLSIMRHLARNRIYREVHECVLLLFHIRTTLLLFRPSSSPATAYVYPQ